MPTVNLSPSVATLVESEGAVLTLNFDVDGDIPEGGLPIVLDIDAASPLWINDFFNFSRTGANADTGEVESLFILRNPSGFGGEISSFSGSLLVRNVPLPFDSIPLILNENQASFELNVFDDFFAEADEVIEFSVGDGTSATFTIQDSPDGIVNPSDVPVVGVTVDAADVLVEDDPATRSLTLTFTTTGDIPEAGLPILFESAAFDVIGDFDFDSIVTEGFGSGGFGGSGIAPVEFGRGFAATLAESTATLTISVNNDNAVEGPETLNFFLTDGENYDVDPSASSATITIDDPPINPPIEGDNGRDKIKGTQRNDTIFGFDGRDIITGRDGNDTIFGGDGVDLIRGGDGIDFIDGGDGNDALYGNQGNDSLTGGEGNDKLFGGDGFDTLDGGAGNDTIRAGEGFSEIFGGAGDDRIFSGENDSFVDGGDGNDRIKTGFFSDDVVFGGQGDDTIITRGDDDIVSGDEGDDTISGGNDEDSLFGGTGDDRIDGEADDDLLSGDAGNDTILGGDGNDLLMGVTGDDVLIGEAGSDTFVFGNGDGTDIIKDFEGGIDKIGLVNGELVFGDLAISIVGDDIALDVIGTGERLAILEDVANTLTLTEVDFVGIDDISSIDAVL
ncbi:MAG: calcium-binding protein [Cyanobacteria bacterium P01_D01_bin.6]